MSVRRESQILPQGLSLNSLVILPDECVDATRARIVGERARQVGVLHSLKVGTELAVGVLGGGRGRGRVLSISADEVVIETTITSEALPRAPISLVVAVPRPQTVKKVLHFATTMGLEAVHFVRADNCEKSYFNSRALTVGEIQEELILGLEQAVDSKAPVVQIHERFRPFAEDVLPQLLLKNSSRLLVADTRSDGRKGLSVLAGSGSFGSVFCAIGPELGWNDFELNCFAECRADFVELGPRILRVETAALVLVSQIMLLQQSK